MPTKTIYVPPRYYALWEQFIAAAEAEGRSASSLLMMLIRDHLEQE